MMDEAIQRVLVAGAGIAGLCAAIAARRVGWNPLVLERHPATRGAGAGVVLWPNGTRVLAQLGVLPALMAQGTVLEGVRVHRIDGCRIGRVDLSNFSARCGAPVVAVDRQVLRAVLLSALPADAVRFEAEIASIAQLGESVHARLHDGETFHGEAMLLAGGLHCGLRDRHVARAEIRMAGVTDWLGIARLPSVSTAHDACEFIGPGLRAGFIALPGGQTYFRFTASDQCQPDAGDAWARLHALFLGRCEALDETLAELRRDTLHIVKESDMAPLARWHVGRVCVLGDAAHGMTPALGQGANQAIVDAWQSAQALSRELRPSHDRGQGDRVARAWARFESQRKPATQAVVTASRDKTALFTTSNDAIMAHWYDEMARLDAPDALAQLYELCRVPPDDAILEESERAVHFDD